MLPSITASNERRKALNDIMVEGNVPLKKWHALFRKYHGNTHYTRTKFRSDLLVGGGHAHEECGIVVPQIDMDKIHAVQAIETDVMSIYSGTVKGVIKKWATNRTFADLQSEAEFVLFKTTHCYIGVSKDAPIAFITYATSAMRNRMIYCYRKRSLLSGVSVEITRLHLQYKETKQQLNRPSTFDEVVEIMDIDDKQRKALERMLVFVCNQSHDEKSALDFSHKNQQLSGVDGKNEWSVVGRRCFGRKATRSILKQVSGDDDGMLEILIKNTRFTEFERVVLEEYLKDADYGWQTRVARTQINPNTGRSVTRMRVGQVWKKITKKLNDTFHEEEKKKKVA